MSRYGRKVAAAVVVAGATALAALACSGSEAAEPTATPVPPIQQVAGDLSYQELLPPLRQGIAPSLQDAAVTRVAVTPTPRPVVSEALAQRIAEQHFARGDLQILYPGIEPAGAFLTTRKLLIAFGGESQIGFPITEPGEDSNRYWVVNFRSRAPDRFLSEYVGVVVDAQSGDVIRVFFGERAPIPPPRLP